MTIEYLQELLKQYGIKPTDKLGQNFLLDDVLLQDMVDGAGVSKKDLVIEIGPGIGNLTRRLLESAGRVVAIEKDPRMAPLLNVLSKEYPHFTFFNTDGLTFDYQSVLEPGQQYRIVANIPYFITGKLVKLFLHLTPRPKSITLLVQKEVAENITARPGSLSILGISVQILGVPKILANVPAFKFYPQPKVNSAVVHIDIPKKSPYSIKSEKDFFRVIKACFLGKRKQIHNTLKDNLGLSSDIIAQGLMASGISSTDRPQQLTIPQWIMLTDYLSSSVKVHS